MNWVIKRSVYRAERNGKLLGYIQKDRDTGLYKWICSAFATRAESKNSGYNATLDGAKIAFEDFWRYSLNYYGLLENPDILIKPDEIDTFSAGDVKDLSEIFV